MPTCLVTKAQNILDTWRDQNKWPLRSREAFKRWRRDGEVFGRFFRSGWDRLPLFRFVEPEQVGSPTGDTSTNKSFGIETDPDDVESRWAYHLWSLDDDGTGEWVDGDLMIHARANVDSTVKQGIPDFYPVYQQLSRVRELIDTILITAIRQAGVAWREKYRTATVTQIGATMPSGPGACPNPPDALNLPWWFNGPGRPGGNRMPPGTVQKVEGDREFADGPVAGGIGNFLEAEQAAIRACCVRWGIPEYTGSADASNNNFASSLVAGSPFAVAVEGSQLEWGTVWERPVALKVLDLAVEAGILTQAERAKLDVEMTEPSVVTPEPEKEAQTLTSLLQAKVVCLDTVRQKLGYDPQHEAEGVKQDAVTQAASQPQPVQDPARASGDSDNPPAGGDDGGDSLDSLFGESFWVSEGAYSMLTEAGKAGLIAKKVTDKDGKQTTVYVKATQDEPKQKPATQAKPVATAPKQPRVPQNAMSDKAKLAKANHKVIGAEIQRYAEEHNEPEFAKEVGGLSFKDNEPVDVVMGEGGVVKHGIELKTMVDNGNSKITMKRSAMDRKADWEKANKATFHTVVIDDQNVFNANGPGKHDKSKRKIFYRRGYGSFRVPTMHQVKSLEELKTLLNTPNEKLPAAAQRKN